MGRFKFRPPCSESTKVKLSHANRKWEVSEAQLRRWYCDELLPTIHIARLIGCSSRTVSKRMKEYGIPMRNRSVALKLANSSGRANFQHGPFGEKAHNWKGGRIERKGDTYVYIQCRNHPRANKKSGYYIGEHVLVWEKSNNRLLPDGWVVHHLNGIKNDNRPENLIGMPRKEHHGWLSYQEYQMRIRTLEEELRVLKASIGVAA